MQRLSLIHICIPAQGDLGIGGKPSIGQQRTEILPQRAAIGHAGKDDALQRAKVDLLPGLALGGGKEGGEAFPQMCIRDSICRPCLY